MKFSTESIAIFSRGLEPWLSQNSNQFYLCSFISPWPQIWILPQKSEWTVSNLQIQCMNQNRNGLKFWKMVSSFDSLGYSKSTWRVKTGLSTFVNASIWSNQLVVIFCSEIYRFGSLHKNIDSPINPKNAIVNLSICNQNLFTTYQHFRLFFQKFQSKTWNCSRHGFSPCIGFLIVREFRKSAFYNEEFRQSDV